MRAVTRQVYGVTRLAEPTVAASRTCLRDQHVPLPEAVEVEVEVGVRHYGLSGVEAVAVSVRPHVLAQAEACQDVPRPAAVVAAGNFRRALPAAGPARSGVQPARSVQKLRQRQ